MLETLNATWQEFMRFDYAHEVLMTGGGILSAFAAFRILKASFRLVVWVALLGLGAGAFTYGSNQSNYELPISDISDIRELGSSMSLDTLRLLCERLQE